MAIIYISCFIYFLKVVICYSDSESAEPNRIEVTPFYDTIIYSDIADIINDIENNGFSPFDVVPNSKESQSDEKVEDLLTEYQHYLEKAHKQRKNYIEKTKTKNKVPLLRHDQYFNTKPGGDFKHNDFYFSNGFYNPGAFKFTQASYNNPLDVFIPFNLKPKYIHSPEVTTTVQKESHTDLLPFHKIIFNDKKKMDLPSLIRKPFLDPIKSSCICKNGNIPCDCDCKQCLIHVENITKDQKIYSPQEQKKNILQHSSAYDHSMKNIEQLVNENTKVSPEHTLNIRIKVDLQLPKQVNPKYDKIHNHDKTIDPEEVASKEFSTTIKLPFPYFNFQVPLNLLGYKHSPKYNKDDTAPIHKITIHKKKKSRTNNNSKKHRKKIITFHNIKLEQQPLVQFHLNDENFTGTNQYYNKSSIPNKTTIRPSATNVLQLEIKSIINKTDDILNDTQNEESVSSVINATNKTFSIINDVFNVLNITNNVSRDVNISREMIYIPSNIYNTSSNATEDNFKSENSIETDFVVLNVTTKQPVTRKRRDVPIIDDKRNNNKSILVEKKNAKKSDKNLVSDAELLYWPNVTSKEKDLNIKNITTIILENEHKKTKLNISKETIRQNHTRALEQAIFGEVDWNDIDTVAPAFMSFVGKYVRGILTFCSQQVCHSMKCANKTCQHRVCVPADRLNNKGHCAGSKSPDSVASMESIMDLPSNIAFEIVDILQNKMLGKIFGKATFCISSKCVTLVASKKIFVKSRCIVKELSTAGHCLTNKTVKI